MAFDALKNLGMKNLLGVKGTSRKSCDITAYDANNQAVESFSIAYTESADGVVSSPLYSTNTGLWQGRHARHISLNVNGTTGQPCTAYLPNTYGHFEASQTRLDSTENSGVYELEAMMFAFAALVVLLAIIGRGVYLAKKGVRAIHEETTEEDNLYYYEGHDGKEYYAVKRRYY